MWYYQGFVILTGCIVVSIGNIACESENCSSCLKHYVKNVTNVVVKKQQIKSVKKHKHCSVKKNSCFDSWFCKNNVFMLQIVCAFTLQIV